jgi:predicted metal-dependent hydrolase
MPRPTCEPVTQANWATHEAYRRGIALFDAGYYWEAHEAWEAGWVACGRTGLEATLLKALIKTAAAGVKACEGNPDGMERHLRRALELLQQARCAAGAVVVLGMDLARLSDLLATCLERREALALAAVAAFGPLGEEGPPAVRALELVLPVVEP